MNTRHITMILLTLFCASCNGDDSSEIAVDNCKLLTTDEVGELAGFEVVVGGETPLGCIYTRPGDLTAQVIVGTASLSEASVRARAESGYPDASEILSVEGVDGDTVAVLTPTGGTVAAILAARGGRFVELGIFMLGIQPGEKEEIQSAAEFAALALDRVSQ